MTDADHAQVVTSLFVVLLLLLNVGIVMIGVPACTSHA